MSLLARRGTGLNTPQNPGLEAKLAAIPAGPGVYIYKDAQGAVLYVGKAKSLRNRVRSYFQKSRNLDQRKDRMTAQIADVEFVVTDTEGEALALENNLIKQNRPKYNVLLRDDKTYPYIKLTVNEAFPRALITRRVRRDGALYFGPFFPGGLARKTLRLVERHFMIRNCNIRIDGKRGRPCLQHYIHRCLGPCVGELSDEKTYRGAIEDVRLFLEGKSAALLESLDEKMEIAAANQQYEAAAHFRDAMRTVPGRSPSGKKWLRQVPTMSTFSVTTETGRRWPCRHSTCGAAAVVNKKEMFWEDQENFQAEDFFGSLLKQYYVDAPFIPIAIHVPVSLRGSATPDRLAVGTERPEGGDPYAPAGRQARDGGVSAAQFPAFVPAAVSLGLPFGIDDRQGSGRDIGSGEDTASHRGIRHLQSAGQRYRRIHGRVEGWGPEQGGLSALYYPVGLWDARRLPQHA